MEGEYNYKYSVKKLNNKTSWKLSLRKAKYFVPQI